MDMRTSYRTYDCTVSVTETVHMEHATVLCGKPCVTERYYSSQYGTSLSMSLSGSDRRRSARLDRPYMVRVASDYTYRHETDAPNA